MLATKLTTSQPPENDARVTEPLGARSGESTELRSSSVADRYRILAELGSGGMGEVLLVHDVLLDRRVALKRVAPERALQPGAGVGVELLREARTQSCVDHPAFVPVHDYGTDSDGATYFTMALVDGETFVELLLHARETSDGRKARSKLLRAFARLCLAVERAHAIGVVHGDIKPANLMLGRNGEVYVLDLGVSSDLLYDAKEAASARGGTRGYGAPEQFHGGAPDVRWDVYALGAVLFEILTLEPLHRNRDRECDVEELYARATTSPRARRPDLDVPPELDRAVVEATRLDAASRTPTAHVLATAIEDYLDGVRDHETRRAIADDYVAQAVALHARSLEPSSGADSVALFRRSVSLLGQALAVVPTHESAAAAMSLVVARAPAEVDRAADLRIESWTEDHLRAAMKAATIAYAAWSVCLPVLFLLGVRDMTLFVELGVSAAATVAFCGWASQRAKVAAIDMVGAATLSAITLGLAARWFGPFGLTSTAFVANGVIFGMMPVREIRWASLGVTVLGMLASGVIGSGGDALSIEADRIVIHAGLTHFPPEATRWAMTLLPIGVAIAGFLVVASTVRSLVEAARRDYRERFHLAAFAPTPVAPPADATRKTS